MRALYFPVTFSGWFTAPLFNSLKRDSAQVQDPLGKVTLSARAFFSAVALRCFGSVLGTTLLSAVLLGSAAVCLSGCVLVPAVILNRGRHTCRWLPSGPLQAENPSQPWELFLAMLRSTKHGVSRGGAIGAECYNASKCSR